MQEQERSAQEESTNTERLWVPWPSWPIDWPWGPVLLAERGQSAVDGAIGDQDLTKLAPYLTPQMFKRIQARPDYQNVIGQYAPVLAKQMNQDPEAQKAFQDLLEEERAVPILIAFGVGLVLGYLAEQ